MTWKLLPKWQNFAKSGHTANRLEDTVCGPHNRFIPNCVTDNNNSMASSSLLEHFPFFLSRQEGW